jgi:hypothetical protein
MTSIGPMPSTQLGIDICGYVKKIASFPPVISNLLLNLFRFHLFWDVMRDVMIDPKNEGEKFIERLFELYVYECVEGKKSIFERGFLSQHLLVGKTLVAIFSREKGLELVMKIGLDKLLEINQKLPYDERKEKVYVALIKDNPVVDGLIRAIL